MPGTPVILPEVPPNSYFVGRGGYATLAAAVAALGSTPATVSFSSDQTLAANLTVPATLEIIPANGAKIVHGAYTVAVASSTVRWPLAQVFDGTGAVSGLRKSCPEWFGLSTSGTAASNTTALNQSINALVTSGEWVAPSGSFNHNGFTISKRIFGRGAGRYATNLNNVAVGVAAVTIADGVTHLDLADMSINGNGTAAYGADATTGDGILTNGLAEFRFENLMLLNHGGHGIKLGGAGSPLAGTYQGEIVNCNIEQNKADGINAIATSSSDQKNALNIYDSNIAGNGGNGINIWGTLIAVRNNSIQGNYGAGVFISSDSATSGSSTNLAITGNYLEINKGGHICGKVTAAKVIQGLTIDDNFFNTNPLLVNPGILYDIFLEDAAGTATNPNLRRLTYGRGNEHLLIGASPPAWTIANFGGRLAQDSTIYSPIRGLASTADNTFYDQIIGAGAAKVVGRQHVVLNGLWYAKGGSGITWADSVKSANVTVSGSNVYFPVTLPTNSQLHRVAAYVDTDSPSYSVQFEFQRRSSAGVGAYTTLYTQTVAMTAAGYVSGADLPSESSTYINQRITPTSNDWILKITVTITTPGTFLYFGNPTIYYY
jgi:hypothetical protein